MVAFLTHCPELTVDVVEDALEHCHGEDRDFVANSTTYYGWTDEATQIVSEMVKNHVIPTQIENIFKSSELKLNYTTRMLLRKRKSILI